MFRQHETTQAVSQPGSGDSYVWIGPSVGVWKAPAHWQDATTGIGGLGNPVWGDTVTIADATVTRGGTASVVTALGTVALQGRYRFGVVHVAGTLEVAFQSAATPALKTLGLSIASAATMYVQQATVDVKHDVTLAGTLTLIYGASMQTGDVTLAPVGDQSPAFLYAQGGQLEIGHLGASSAASILVDAGSTLAGSGTVVGSIEDDGSIVATHALSALDGIGGTGLLRIDAGASLDVGMVAAGVRVAFAGPGAALTVHGGTSPGDLPATIGDFAAGDTIELAGLLTAETATYSYAGNDFGRLTLSDAHDRAIGSLDLAGDYRDAAFTLTPQPSLGPLITVAGHAA